MKRFFILASAAIVALASCAKTEVVSTDGPQEIAFKQLAGPMTKGESETPLENLNQTMGVFAFYHLTQDATPGVYLLNKEFAPQSSGASIWDGAGDAHYYWPLQGYLDFVVYSPYASSANFNEQKLTLTIPSNRTEQTDWVVSSAIHKDQQYKSEGNKVTLKHILSLITINVKGNVDGVFNVSNVNLTNLEDNGTVVANYANDDVEITGSNTVDTDNYGHDFAGPSSTLTTTASPCGNSHLVFPSKASHDITVTYTIAGTEPTSMTAKVTIPEVEWLPGYHYTYNLTLTANEILLDPVVSQWNTGTISAITDTNPSVN